MLSGGTVGRGAGGEEGTEIGREIGGGGWGGAGVSSFCEGGSKEEKTKWIGCRSLDEERGRSETEEGLQKIEKGKRRARICRGGGEDIINAFSG
jgi:hypothetical protein